MDKQKIIIGTGLIATALYLSSTGGETYQTGAGSLGSDLMGGGGSDSGLSEVDETPDSIIDDIKKSFNWPEIYDTPVFDKKYGVAQNYTEANKPFIESIITPDLKDIPGIPISVAKIYRPDNGTGKATVVPKSLTDYADYIAPKKTENRLSDIVTGMKAGAGPSDYNIGVGYYSDGGKGKGTGKVTVKKQAAGPKKKDGTDVFGRSPIKKKKYKNR